MQNKSAFPKISVITATYNRADFLEKTILSIINQNYPNKVGSKLDTKLKYAGDADLWFRFFEHAILYDVSVPLAKFRIHENQITSRLRQSYEAEVEILLNRYGGKNYNLITSNLRKIARKYTPFRLRRLAYYLNLLYPCYRLQYSFSKKDWEIKKNYY